jgi:polysaccharide deacetylase 2 family uncharacterized protein YibQ
MNEIKQRGLIYVDSTNSARSASLQLANELGVGYGAAEVVIDSEETKENIDKALTRLETIAQERGLAFGLGSNSPLTIKQVSDWANSLEAKGIVLVPVSAMVRARQRT